MIPTSTYVLVYGIPIWTIIWSILLYTVIGDKAFGPRKKEKPKEESKK